MVSDVVVEALFITGEYRFFNLYSSPVMDTLNIVQHRNDPTFFNCYKFEDLYSFQASHCVCNAAEESLLLYVFDAN